jgi:hypothetical protein
MQSIDRVPQNCRILRLPLGKCRRVATEGPGCHAQSLGAPLMLSGLADPHRQVDPLNLA